MKIVVLAVLLAIMQAAPPVPRKAADSASKASRSVKHQTKPQNAQPAQSQPIADANQSPHHDDTRQNQASNDTKHSVDITKLPTVSVEPDWGMWIFSCLLVVVGGIQAWLLYRTWGQIQRQAGIMEGQLTAIQESGKQTDKLIAATKESADAALKNAEAVVKSERPWMLIEFNVARDGSNVTIRFRNHGRTPAEIIGFTHTFTCYSSTFKLPPTAEYGDEGRLFAHTRIIASEGHWEHPAENFYDFNQSFPQELAEIRTGAKYIYYWGRLRYMDLIETVDYSNLDKMLTSIHETCFCYRYNINLTEFRTDGPPGYNKHT